MAGGGELAAVFRSLAEDAAQAGENIGKSMSRFFEDTAERADASVDTTSGRPGSQHSGGACDPSTRREPEPALPLPPESLTAAISVRSRACSWVYPPFSPEDADAGPSSLMPPVSRWSCRGHRMNHRG